MRGCAGARGRDCVGRRVRGWFFSGFELRDIAAARQRDAPGRARAVAVVLVQAAAQAAGFDADNRGPASPMVLVVAVEHFDADCVLLQLARVAGQRVLVLTM